MYSLRFLTVALILAVSVLADEPAPDWSKKTFAAPPDLVFAAALKSIALQHHEVKSKDEVNRVVSFHVGTTAWSWGYNMVLKVAPAGNNSSNVSIEIARSGGKAVSWGSEKKEVLKIFAGIEKELPQTPPRETKNCA
jgi:hypothetical protein